MKEWLESKRTIYLDRLLQNKAGPKLTSKCATCEKGRPVWRCLDCIDLRPTCVLCCRDSHQNNLFHRIEKWNGRCYQKASLWQVGVKIYAGHNGQPCPNSTANIFKISLEEAERLAMEIQANADREQAAMEAGVSSTPNVADIPIDANLEDLRYDNCWEDEDPRPKKGHSPRFLPSPPPSDSAGNPFITVVHTNGFHSLPVIWCGCGANIDDRDLQMLDLRLYPASYKSIRTVFTFDCLNEFRTESLECKASHYQYHNKLQCLTCSRYPDAAPNRYAELCRVVRQWRNMKHRCWFWHLDNKEPERGQMALFCAACPQPGINLEQNWETEQVLSP